MTQQRRHSDQAREGRAGEVEESAPTCRAMQRSGCRTQQIPPLRYAPVGMTGKRRASAGGFIVPPRAAFRGACPERSVGAALARGYVYCAPAGL